MVFIPRRVCKITNHTNDLDFPISDFRNEAAWVLLGDPGAGKTSIFKEEEEICNGLYYPSISIFLDDSEFDSKKEGKTIFLDGLDEVEGNFRDIFYKIKNKIGTCHFRIACRALNWSRIEEGDFFNIFNTNIMVLKLVPLNEENISEILCNEHEIEKPEEFIEKTKRKGVFPLLDNPQLLSFFAKNLPDESINTQKDLFELACKKLVEEKNKIHRETNSHKKNYSPEDLLDAAGYLFSVLLFSNKAGIALDSDAKDKHFFILDNLELNTTRAPYFDIAKTVLKRSVFKLAYKEECAEPYHRSVAEYLAARWLAKEICNKHLSRKRILGLISIDGKAVYNLQGLYGWLAVHSFSLREDLIRLDALATLSGDIKAMSPKNKLQIIEGLRKEVKKRHSLWRDINSISNLGDLADKKLINFFIEELNSDKCDEDTQSFIVCILQILENGEPMQELLLTLEKIIKDKDRWSFIRTQSLKIWLKMRNNEDALNLLDSIKRNEIIDAEDELSGILLNHLYPKYIPDQMILDYLHLPKKDNFFGMYVHFWAVKFVNVIKESHVNIPIFLDQLSNRADLNLSTWHLSYLGTLFSELLYYGIQNHGQDVSNERLLHWLRFACDNYGLLKIVSHKQDLFNWLDENTDRHKALLAQHPEQTILCKPIYSDSQNDELLSYQLEIQKNILKERENNQSKNSSDISPHIQNIKNGIANEEVYNYLADIWNGLRTIDRTPIGNTPLERFINYFKDYREIYDASIKGFRLCLERKDLPKMDDIIKLNIGNQKHLISEPCLIGMDQLWLHENNKINFLSKETLRCMVSIVLVHGLEEMPEWFTYLVKNQPDLIADVLIKYTITTLKAKKSFINGMRLLSSDLVYRNVALIATPILLERFPLQVTSQQLDYLGILLRTALRYPEIELSAILEKKINMKDRYAVQKTYWLTCALLIHPKKYEAKFFAYVEESWQRIYSSLDFLTYLYGLNFQLNFSPKILSKLIKLFMGYTESNKSENRNIDQNYFHEIRMQVSNFMSAFLVQENTKEAIKEIDILLEELPELHPFKMTLEDIRYELQKKNLETSPKLNEVVKILRNEAPENIKDLTFVVLDCLDDVKHKIQNDECDLFNLFWDKKEKNQFEPKFEGDCRNVILDQLKSKLDSWVQFTKESEGFNKKKPDILISCSSFRLPIEAKVQNNTHLWDDVRNQLIEKYASKENEYGIYIVFWFGSTYPQASPKDGGKKPTSPQELEDRLTKFTLSTEEQKRIFICVIDVSRPI
jgi:hypothetical protein